MGKMSRTDVYDYLLEHGVSADTATLYAVAFLEYEAAQENIGRLGAVVSNPRTGVPIDNPFLKVRDRAEAKLSSYGDRLPADAVRELWSYLNSGTVPERLEAPDPGDLGDDDLPF